MSVGTVNGDLKFNSENEPAPITNSRGQQRPATYARTEPDDDVIDAEIVEDFCTRCGATTDDCTCDQSQQKATDPAPAEPVETVTCPTCAGTGKVTR